MRDDALILAEAATRLLADDPDGASEVLAGLAQTDPIERIRRQTGGATERPPRLPRVPVPKTLAAGVFKRDGWRCHYCGRRVVVAGVIELIGRLCPADVPFPPGHHMSKGRTHPAAERVYPNVDHVQALSLGGAATAPANLITACTPCNEKKGGRLGWERIELERDEWDGLASTYRPLLELTGVPSTSTQRQWMRALGV